MMDPITLILAVLAAGAAAGMGDTASQAVEDAYADNLSDPADLAGLWPAGRARVIITTRRRGATLTGGAGP